MPRVQESTSPSLLSHLDLDFRDAAEGANGVGQLLPAVPAARAVQVADDVVDTLSPALEAAHEAARALQVTEALYGLATRVMSADQISESTAGRVANAAAHTALDVLMTPTVASVATSVLDGVTADASAAKPVTYAVAQAVPTSFAGAGLHAALDAASVGGAALVGGAAAAFRQADVLERRSLAGAYGPVTQAATMATMLATDPSRLACAVTGPAAESGALGPLVRLGNQLGDRLYELTAP